MDLLSDVRLIHPEEIVANSPEQTCKKRNPFALRVSISHNESSSEIGVVPDLVFGLQFSNGSHRCFMVEVDRGTMPITRGNIAQSSFERKMRAYLAAHAEGRHEQQFGWKTFRVLVVTTDQQRVRSMLGALQRLTAEKKPASALFLFALRDDLRLSAPIAEVWHDSSGRISD